jgi:two-component system, LytTR family, sensor kinase
MNAEPLLPEENKTRWWVVWVVSFGVWTALGAFDGALQYQWMRQRGQPIEWKYLLNVELVNYFIAAVTSPGVYWLALRFPLARGKWATNLPIHVVGCFLFTAVHAVGRVVASPVRDSAGHLRPVNAELMWWMFLAVVFSDVTVYWPIVGLAHLVEYHKKYKDRDLRASQLETKLVAAQLHALKMQLQPHFLFNTLHSISALMRIDPDAADQMIARLSDLLRLTLETANLQEGSLKRELELLNGYLQIEQTRFSDRLSVSLEIDPEAYDATVPYMIMQPLAENAVRHGVSKLMSPGRIVVRASRDDGWLRLAVQDNGPGFESTEDQPNTGVGLRNTRERLEKLYGARQKLQVSPVSSGGVEVSITLPYSRFEGQEQKL